MRLILLWLAAMASAGTTDETVIELEHAPGEEPDYVCVITGTGANDLVPLEALGHFEAVDPKDPESARWFTIDPRADWDLAAVPRAARDTWEPEALADVAVSGPTAAAGGACGAGEPDPARACREPDPACCAPELHLKQDRAVRAESYRVACAENVRAHEGPDGGRTLLMSVDFEHPRGFSPIIRGVRLDGSVVHLKYRGDVRSWPFPVVSVIGGDYVEGRSRVMAERQAVLDITPRCMVHDVQLPPMVRKTEEGAIALSAHLESPADHEVSSCQAELRAGSRFEIALPFLDAPGEKVLRVEAREAGEEAVSAEFRASWYSARAPEIADAGARNVSFGWLAHCMYAGGGEGLACPNAILEEHGIRCQSSAEPDANGVCSYQCAQPGQALEFALPTRVRLEGPYEDRWTEQLSFVGEVLDGYVPIEERRLTVDFSAWGSDAEAVAHQVGVVGDMIRYVEVASPNGSTHRVVPQGDGHQRLFVPGATCGDLLTYRVHGDRLYYEQAVKVESGQLRLGHPRADGQVMSINFGMMGGLSAGFGNRAYAQPVGSLSAAISIRPFGAVRDAPGRRAVWFEFPHVSSSVSSHPYDALPPDTSGPAPNKEHRLYHRLNGSALVLVRPVDERLSVGLGPGIFAGYAVYSSQIDQLGGVRIHPSGNLDLRWHMGRDVAVSTSIRAFPTFRKKYLWNPSGRPDTRISDMVGTEFQGGLRFGR